MLPIGTPSYGRCVREDNVSHSCRHTDEHARQVGGICRLCQQLVDSVLDAERLVQLARDGCQRTVRRLVDATAAHVDADSQMCLVVGELLLRCAGGAALDALQFHFGRRPEPQPEISIVSFAVEGKADHE